MALLTQNVSMAFQKGAAGPGGGGGGGAWGTSYNGLYQEALPKRGTFFMLQV